MILVGGCIFVKHNIIVSCQMWLKLKQWKLLGRTDRWVARITIETLSLPACFIQSVKAVQKVIKERNKPLSLELALR